MVYRCSCTFDTVYRNDTRRNEAKFTDENMYTRTRASEHAIRINTSTPNSPSARRRMLESERFALSNMHSPACPLHASATAWRTAPRYKMTAVLTGKRSGLPETDARALVCKRVSASTGNYAGARSYNYSKFFASNYHAHVINLDGSDFLSKIV